MEPPPRRPPSLPGFTTPPRPASETHVCLHVADSAAAQCSAVRPTAGFHQCGHRDRPGAAEPQPESEAAPGPESQGEPL